MKSFIAIAVALIAATTSAVSLDGQAVTEAHFEMIEGMHCYNNEWVCNRSCGRLDWACRNQCAAARNACLKE